MHILGRTAMNFKACTSPKRDFEIDRKKRSPAEDAAAGQPSAKRPMIVKNSDGTMQTVVKMENEETGTEESTPPSPSGEFMLSLTLPGKETGLRVLRYVQDIMSGDVTRGVAVNKKYFKQISKQIGK